jgi:autotransporter family porin
MSGDDTAFNVDYVYSYIRACYEGWISYLFEKIPVSGYPPYQAGDIWGCIGSHFSGGWYDQDAIYYINKVKTSLANEVWLHSGF